MGATATDIFAVRMSQLLSLQNISTACCSFSFSSSLSDHMPYILSFTFYLFTLFIFYPSLPRLVFTFYLIPLLSDNVFDLCGNQSFLYDNEWWCQSSIFNSNLNRKVSIQKLHDIVLYSWHRIMSHLPFPLIHPSLPVIYRTYRNSSQWILELSITWQLHLYIP